MLTEPQKIIISQIKTYVKQILADDFSGHDMAHIERVVHLANHIQKTEPDSDLFIITISAYLHDVMDSKLIDDVALARQNLILFLNQQKIDKQTQQQIFLIIDNMSFSKNLSFKQTLSKEGQIVQDADRLDAIGAIGIARTFSYGAVKKHVMYDPKIKPKTHLSIENYRQPNTIINHFYEKLFLLKDQMNTQEGKRIANKRHQFLVDFVKQFENEWLSDFSE